jgi:hypothetical protein
MWKYSFFILVVCPSIYGFWLPLDIFKLIFPFNGVLTYIFAKTEYVLDNELNKKGDIYSMFVFSITFTERFIQWMLLAYILDSPILLRKALLINNSENVIMKDSKCHNLLKMALWLMGIWKTKKPDKMLRTNGHPDK